MFGELYGILMSDDNTTGAILTPSQREFLQKGPSEGSSDAAARMTRGRIEDRVRVAVLEDASIIADSLDDGPKLELEKIADKSESGQVAEGIRSMVAFLYRLADATGADPEKAIEDGMNRSRGERLQRILEKLEGDPATTMSPDELQTLNEHGFLPNGAHAELFKSWLGTGGNIDVGTVREAMDREDTEE